jgi:medium-chain acyl-[acyl-carrier-protein] hydrolase
VRQTPAPEVWHEDVRAHSYDVDFRKRATAQAICRTFLEAAWNHAEQLGFGYSALTRQGRFWVLARMLVEIHSSPAWGDQLQLCTWPCGISGLFALRDFEFSDRQGQNLIAGTSSWLILDAVSHRPQRLDRMDTTFPTAERRPAIGREAGKIPVVPSPGSALSAAVQYSHIDVNLHVNSAQYVGWLVDSYPQNFHNGHVLRSIELNYTGETRWSDTISVLTSQLEPLRFAHSIVRADGSEVCRAVLAWTPT